MISYTMTNYVELYYDILNYTLLRSLMSPRYLVNSTESSMQKTPRGGNIIGPYIYIYIYIYIYNIVVYIYIYIYIHILTNTNYYLNYDHSYRRAGREYNCSLNELRLLRQARGITC